MGCLGVRNWGRGRKHTVSYQSADPMLDQVRGMKYIANNEIPRHKYFNVDACKPLCEQRGTPLLSRGLHKDPEPWRPMGGITCTSQHMLVLTEEQCLDIGSKRRLNYFKYLAEDLAELKSKKDQNPKP